MSENLCPPVHKDQRQLVGKAFAIMLDDNAVRFVFFPMVDEFDGPPMGNVPVFSMAEDSVEHAGCCQQADVAALQRGEFPALSAVCLLPTLPASPGIRGLCRYPVAPGRL
jgi:hypothetical protein